jgi:hypothetical protein
VKDQFFHFRKTSTGEDRKILGKGVIGEEGIVKKCPKIKNAPIQGHFLIPEKYSTVSRF